VFSILLQIMEDGRWVPGRLTHAASRQCLAPCSTRGMCSSGRHSSPSSSMPVLTWPLPCPPP
jgi:hypothetical protein